MRHHLITVLAVTALLAAACSSGETTTASLDDSDATTTVAADDSAAETEDTEVAETGDDAVVESGTTSTFVAEVWADNWFSLSVNGEYIGEDSVSITTERSFNAETLTFEATYPLTIAVEAKDYKETDSGLEYIGENNQQMGDGGFILQITDEATGSVIATSSGDWQALVIHEAPLNKDCEDSSDPDAECEFSISDAPDGWTGVDFDDSAWSSATVWSAADVDPKIGYDEIAWSAAAELIWGPDLEADNTVLLRTTVGS